MLALVTFWWLAPALDQARRPLGAALSLMQVPAVTRGYQAALLQVVRSCGREIAERKASVQRLSR